MKQISAILAIFLAFAFASTALTASLFPGEDWESGLVDLGNSGDDIFYILYRHRNASERGKRLIVWFQGGPGCSGFLANMLENGPYLFDKNSTFVRNPYSWNELADLMYIDQPVGTGFSRMRGEDTNCGNESCIAQDMYKFFVKFIAGHPEYKGKPIYLFGQSFAGQYIPAVAAYLMKANNPDIVIKGAGIGNGEEDFSLQLGTHPQYGYDNGLLSAFEFLLQQIDALICQVSLRLLPPSDTQRTLCLNAFEEMGKKVPNPSDIKDPGGYGQIVAIIKWLQQADTRAQLNVRGRSFDICNLTIYNRFIYDILYYSIDDLTFLVNSGLNVLLYHGDNDAVCNWLGGKLVTEELVWPGKAGFNAESMRDISVAGKAYGAYKRFQNLAFVRIFNAGHFSPYNQPAGTLHMAQWLINSFV